MSITQPLTRSLTQAITRRLTDPGAGGGAAPFDPASVFSTEPGGIYDFSDTALIFQDSSGTGAVADTNPVGYVTDLSPNSKPATIATSGMRPLYDAATPGCVFDGANDNLVTAAMDFTGTNKVTVVACLVNNQTSGFGSPFNLGANIIATAGNFGAYVSLGSGGDFSIGGTGSGGSNFSSAPGGTMPRLAVVSWLYDLSQTNWQDALKVRVNGVQQTLSLGGGGNLGGGNFNNDVFHIGAIDGAFNPFTGTYVRLMLIGRQLTTEELENMEAWAGEPTGFF